MTLKMESSDPLYNPHILAVLKHFQNSAKQSLRGPNLEMANVVLSPSEMDDCIKSLQEVSRNVVNRSCTTDSPLLLPQDTYTGERCETMLEGETITGFMIGGEKRLCLPQILHTSLGNCSMEEVQNACDDLHIYLSRCNAIQLQILKDARILPPDAKNSGLITNTDAERLCGRLFNNPQELSSHTPTSNNSFKVYHECFGKCIGIFSPELYLTEASACIECYDCCGLFSPQKFVSHSHSPSESSVCHWGFDATNWRSYLLLAKNQDDQKDLLKRLVEMKDKFSGKNKVKRKESEVRVEDIVYKRRKVSDGCDGIKTKNDHKLPAKLRNRQISLPEEIAPKLLHPERVVPFAERDRYGRDFVPNVSLAPVSSNAKYTRKEENEEKLEYLEENFTELSDSENDTSSEDAMDLSVQEDKELSFVKEALQGSSLKTDQEKDHFLKVFLEVKKSCNIKLLNLVRTNASLNQELLHVRRKKQRKIEKLKASQRGICREIGKLRTERRNVLRENERLMYEMNTLQQDLAKIHCSHSEETELLQNRADKFEEMYRQAREEVFSLREQIKRNVTKSVHS